MVPFSIFQMTSISFCWWYASLEGHAFFLKLSLRGEAYGLLFAEARPHDLWRSMGPRATVISSGTNRNRNENRTAGTIEIEIFGRLWKIYVDNVEVVLFLKIWIVKPHSSISMIEVDFQVFEDETSIPPTRLTFFNPLKLEGTACGWLPPSGRKSVKGHSAAELRFFS